MSENTVKTAEQESAEQVEELTALRRRVTETMSREMVQEFITQAYCLGGKHQHQLEKRYSLWRR